MKDKEDEKYRNQPDRQRRHLRPGVILGEALVLALGLTAGYFFLREEEAKVAMVEPLEVISTEAETETEARILVKKVERPDVDEQILTVNPFSRPGERTDGIRYIVIHYLANPGTTAQQNHDYFESLKEQDMDLDDENAVAMSANFIVGLDGEIVQCVPENEIAYASNGANHESISIENCHPDETGEFTEATYKSLVHLAAYLVDKYNLGREDIRRHYDVTSWHKACPLYFVDHEDAWEKLKDDIFAYIEECKEQ